VLHTALRLDREAGEVVQVLLDAKANPEDQEDNEDFLLHAAFRHGADSAIPVLREHPGSRELAEDWDRDGTPLEIGFDSGRLNHKKLVELAPRTCRSLLTILAKAPYCVPAFLQSDALPSDELRKLSGGSEEELKIKSEYIEK
jgi:ankyrin repeat protein